MVVVCVFLVFFVLGIFWFSVLCVVIVGVFLLWVLRASPAWCWHGWYPSA